MFRPLPGVVLHGRAWQSHKTTTVEVDDDGVDFQNIVWRTAVKWAKLDAASIE